MAMRRVASSAVRALASRYPASSITYRNHSASAESKKIVGVFYKANEYASANPDFLGCAENALGIREWLESKGHQYTVTDDKEGPDCELEKHIPDLHVLISTPFHPAYVTAERIKKAKNLQLLLTAGVGSDHIDLQAAAAAGLTVAEVTGRKKSRPDNGEKQLLDRVCITCILCCLLVKKPLHDVVSSNCSYYTTVVLRNL